MNGENVDINYDHPLYVPNFEDPYWETIGQGLLVDDEEEYDEPTTPTNQGIVQWEECPSPNRRIEGGKRVIVSVGTQRLATKLFLPTANTEELISVKEILKLIPQPPIAIQQESSNAPVEDVAIDLENEDPVDGVLDITDDPPVDGLKKGKLYRDLAQHERDWRQQLTWREGELRTSVLRRHRDTREWINMEEKHRLRRVHEYSADSVRDGKRRKIKLCSDHPEFHPLTPYQNHHA